MQCRLATNADEEVLAELAEAAGWDIISYPNEWESRLGDGTGDWTGLTLVAESPAGEVVGFLWADNTLRIDHRMPVQWLCLNALYVRPESRSQGAGAELVQAAVMRARELGMDLVHGQCLPSVSVWWKSQGFEAEEADGRWYTPLTVDGKTFVVYSEGNCPFWLLLSPGYTKILSSKA